MTYAGCGVLMKCAVRRCSIMVVGLAPPTWGIRDLGADLFVSHVPCALSRKE